MSGLEGTLALLNPISFPNASLIINHFFSPCLTKDTPSQSRFLQPRPAALLNSASEKLKLLPQGYTATPWLHQVTETPLMEWWLYSHLLSEKFSLSDTPSPLQLPQGLHSTAGDSWPCSSGALQPKQGHLLRAESWHQDGFGLGRKILIL